MASETNPDPSLGRPETQTGSCLCGAVTYTLSGTPATTVLCHCVSCKKSSGSSFMANWFYQSSQLNMTSGTSSLKIYVDKSPDAGRYVERSFCTQCGSSLFLRSPKFDGTVIVASGALDNQETLKAWKPDNEFFCKTKGTWLEKAGADEGKKFMGMT